MDMAAVIVLTRNVYVIQVSGLLALVLKRS